MTDVIDDIAEAQDSLNSVDDQLSAAIRMLEHALHQRISVRIETECTGETFSRVAFGKLKGNWSFLVELGGEWHALTSCARDIRATALSGGHLKRLVLESADSIRNTVTGRRAATSAAQELLELLNTSPGD